MTDVPDLPPSVALSGRSVRLEPLDDAHIEELAQAANDIRIWRYSSPGSAGVEAYLETALSNRAKGEQLPFAVRLLAGDRLVGMSRLFEVDAAHRRLELGYTWYVPEVWGTAVNPEAKRLLLGHAFDGWDAKRVQFKIDNANLRSQAAVAKLGAQREGLLRAHMIRIDGSRRDSAIYSIIADEWPGVRAALDARLAQFEV